MKVKKNLLHFISSERDHSLRIKTARGEEKEFLSLSPCDRLTVLFILSHDRESEIADLASASLDTMVPTLILNALKERLNYLVLRDLFVRFRDNASILSAIAANADIDDRLAAAIAEEGSEDTIKAFEDNPSLQDILASITEGLKKNPLADQALAERLEKAAKEKTGPLHEDEDLNDLVSQEEVVDSDRFNISQSLSRMTAGEKIKLAHTGDRSVRNILIKDKNRVVALSVLKNPKLTEQEVVTTIASTSVSEDIIRDIANTRKWMKSYKVKTAMVLNPHTPLSFSLKIVGYLRDKELKQLAKNKGIPGALVNAAARKLKLAQR